MLRKFLFENPWDDNGKKKRPSNSNTDDSFDKLLNSLQEKFQDLLSGGGNKGGNAPSSGAYIKIFALIALIAWGASGLYKINPDEQGVVLRFGAFNRLGVPGINYRLPYPIETVEKVSITRVQTETIGMQQSAVRSLRLSRRQNQETANSDWKSQMLTGDENIISIDFDVQWQVKDAKDFLFNVRDLPGENTVKKAAESAMREVIGAIPLSLALAEKRSEIETKAKNLLQNMLDSYSRGVTILRLQLLRVEPPSEVLDAYREVQSSKADKERFINDAEAYRNDILPRARGEAEKIMQEAEAYRDATIAIAQGEAKRFDDILKEYLFSKDVTKQRMYIDAMRSVMGKVNKVIVDDGIAKNMLPHMPIQNLLENKGYRNSINKGTENE